MTKSEIHNIFDIPISTLNEWQKPDSRKHKLYSFLIKSDKSYIDKITNTKKYHRLFNVLNRNIDRQYKYTFDEIQKAFSQDNYNNATNREQLIYSKFFKEFESDELEELCLHFEISKRNIKSIYASSPFIKLKGVAKVWSKRFRIKYIQEPVITSKTTTPSALQLILNKRALNV
jgi:hypothetical protein